MAEALGKVPDVLLQSNQLTMNSPKYTLNNTDLKKIGQAILFSAASAVISTLILLVGEIDFGAYAFLIPTVNAALYSVKKFLEGR